MIQDIGLKLRSIHEHLLDLSSHIDNTFSLNAIYVFLISFIIVVIAFWRRKRPYKYKSIENIFTNTERHFYFKLNDAIDGRYHIFAKVRVADAITPDEKKDHWQSAFNKIKAKHFDYILCDDDLNIIAAIELDDSSHQRPDRIERDIFLNKACRSAGLPLIRFRTNQDYLPSQIYKTIKKSI